jgi:hypothetical protein
VKKNKLLADQPVLDSSNIQYKVIKPVPVTPLKKAHCSAKPGSGGGTRPGDYPNDFFEGRS